MNKLPAVLFLTFASVLSLLSACDSLGPNVTTVTPKLEYSRDDRTDKCFASWMLGYQHGVMAQVECSDKVLELVPVGQRPKKALTLKERCESLGMVFSCFQSEVGEGPCFCSEHDR